ncbi:MAG: GHKL domain-containing protein [Acidobacteria bacterium]|nr:GHKL domain-containing protein [Acidobacteriota bacterium]
MSEGNLPEDTLQASDLTLPGLVHDLNNVFETISEAAEVIGDDPRWAGIAGAIQRSVDHGRRIVGCYAGQSRVGPELDGIVERAATFLQDFLTHMTGGKVSVTRRIEDGLRVQGAPNDWERVFMNLFLNAAQAMRESGGGEISVDARLEDNAVFVQVADTGPGIPDAILSKIFRPRFSTKSKQTGLGLHIVYTIVKDNGGTVKAANREEGTGAVFTILAPAVAGD